MTPGRRARCRDRRLRGRRRRVFPRPRRRPEGHPRPGAERADRRWRDAVPARRDPLRRRHRPDAFPRRPTGAAAAASRSTAGSPASHVAMLARSRGVPMVVGLGSAAPTASGDGAARRRARRHGLGPGAGRRRALSRRVARISPTARARGRGRSASPAAHRRRDAGPRPWSTSPSRPTSTASTSRPATASG